MLAVDYCVGLDLDQGGGTEEGDHLYGGARRRVGRVDVGVANGTDDRQERDVGDEDVQLHDIGERRTGGSQATLQVREDLPGLRLRIVFADQLPVAVERDLPGDRHPPSRPGHHMAVTVARGNTFGLRIREIRQGFLQ